MDFRHAAGDRILRIVAERLSESVRTSDVVARTSGDGFLMLLDHLDTSLDTAAEQCRTGIQKFTAAVRLPIRIGEHEVVCRCSAGIAMENGQSGSAA